MAEKFNGNSSYSKSKKFAAAHTLKAEILDFSDKTVSQKNISKPFVKAAAWVC